MAVRRAWKDSWILTIRRLQQQSSKTNPWLLHSRITNQGENWCWMRIQSLIWTPPQTHPSIWISSPKCQQMTPDSKRSKSMISPFNWWNLHPRSPLLKHSKESKRSRRKSIRRRSNRRKEPRSRLWRLRKQSQTSRVELLRFSKRSAKLILMRTLVSRRPSAVAVSMMTCSKQACKQQLQNMGWSSAVWPSSMNNLTCL